ncbi:MAG: hypothetical protein KF861_19315, partial [Planctomycetaceae bacterium]|nr:hypothetical protein [Planctomycetaceae bacterium]
MTSSIDSSPAGGDAAAGSQLFPTASHAKRLVPAAQESYLHLLTRGASPAAACGQIGMSVLDVLATIEQDEAFRLRLEQVNVLLSQNVAAALYRSAMEGSVSAQTFFLKNQPPPNWQPG